ncbi:MAG: hypothetical protein ACOX9C_03545 [Kiritimatiellia bacterium]
MQARHPRVQADNQPLVFQNGLRRADGFEPAVFIGACEQAVVPLLGRKEEDHLLDSMTVAEIRKLTRIGFQTGSG